MFWRRKNKHTHHWDPLSTSHGQTMEGYEATQILMRCACGEYATQTILGHWHMHELERTPGAAGAVELAELRKITGIQ